MKPIKLKATHDQLKIVGQVLEHEIRVRLNDAIVDIINSIRKSIHTRIARKLLDGSEKYSITLLRHELLVLQLSLSLRVNDYQADSYEANEIRILIIVLERYIR